MPEHLINAAMRKFGGSFVKALAEAARCADPQNLERLQNAFPEIWQRYAALAKSEAPTTVLE